MEQNKTLSFFGITKEELTELFRIKRNAKGLTKTILILVGILLTPISLIGALFFYKKGFHTFMEPNNEAPRMSNLRPIMRIAMIAGAILIWLALYIFLKLVVSAIMLFGGMEAGGDTKFILIFIFVNAVLTGFIFWTFSNWRGRIYKFMAESARFGTARFARMKELLPYREAKGFYIGFDMFYKKAGHLLTVAGTRAGKAVNLILFNLLLPDLFKGSWVIIDPKGELASISARIQREAGRKVVILNPFSLLSLGNVNYNPLSILKSDWINLADDVTMMAEAIVAQVTGENKHFQDRARSFISTFLLHLVTSAPKEDRHLGTLWAWLRLDPKEFNMLLAEMVLNDDPNVGDIVKAGANEIISMMTNSDKEFGSVMSNAFEATGFIKSPSLRESLKGSDEFTAEDLAAGNVTVYLCIPFDRLTSHNAWLRLVVTSLMRSVIRKPGKDVCFLIDEANSFGFHSEVLTAMSAYAGFGVHIWSIFQDLSQIENIYGKNWQTFIANSSVRHYFNISDNFSADYLEKHFGMSSVPTYNDKGTISGATARPLVTGDEIRRESGEMIYTVIDQLPPTKIEKAPYYETDLDYDPNPYHKVEIIDPYGNDKTKQE